MFAVLVSCTPTSIQEAEYSSDECLVLLPRLGVAWVESAVSWCVLLDAYLCINPTTPHYRGLSYHSERALGNIIEE